MEGICVSSGSACTSGSNKRSHVLKAIYGESDTTAVIRFSFGLSTNMNDIHSATEATKSVILRMRKQLD
jgi:cysteine desulfurase